MRIDLSHHGVALPESLGQQAAEYGLGPEGCSPLVSLGEDDAGAVAVGVSHDTNYGYVVMNLGPGLGWLAGTPAEMLDLAQALTDAAARGIQVIDESVGFAAPMGVPG